MHALRQVKERLHERRQSEACRRARGPQAEHAERRHRQKPHPGGKEGERNAAPRTQAAHEALTANALTSEIGSLLAALKKKDVSNSPEVQVEAGGKEAREPANFLRRGAGVIERMDDLSEEQKLANALTQTARNWNISEEAVAKLRDSILEQQCA